MGLSSLIVWELRAGGADTNGGGFKAGASGTDWTQQNAAQYSVTDAVTNGTTTVTSATANFGTDVVGNVLYIQGGTAPVTAGWYEITGRTNSTTITVDRSTGLTAGTGATLKIGGALATPNQVCTNAVSGNIAYAKAGAFAAVGTKFSFWIEGRFEGYTTTRGDGGQVTFAASAAITLADFASANSSTLFSVRNVDFDGNSTGTIGLDLNRQNQVELWNCRFRRFTSHGCQNSYYGDIAATKCQFYSNGGRGFYGVALVGPTLFFLGCEFHDNTSDGAAADSGTIAYAFCLAYNNGGVGIAAAVPAGVAAAVTNCTAYGNTGHGFATDRGGFQYEFPRLFANCIAYGNGGYGFNHPGSSSGPFYGTFLLNCAYGGNTSGNFNFPAAQSVGGISLTADPFTNAAGGDFSLNTTAGGGSACRAAGFPGVFPGGLTTGYPDVGTVQHQDSGGGQSPTLGAYVETSDVAWA